MTKDALINRTYIKKNKKKNDNADNKQKIHFKDGTITLANTSTTNEENLRYTKI